jgi:hypothetical protein
MRDGRAEDEAPGLDADDLVNLRIVIAMLLYKQVDRRAEGLRMPQQRRDVLEDDAGLGIVRNVADILLQVHGLRASGRLLDTRVDRARGRRNPRISAQER